MQKYNTDKKSLLTEVRSSFDALFEVTSQLDEELINRPEENGWTIGQILEHIIKSQVGIIRLMRGPSSTVSRSPVQKIEEFQEKLSNDELKFTAREGIIPGDSKKDFDLMIAKFHSNQVAIEYLVNECDMSKEFTGFSLPKVGNFTGIEWVYFEQSHTGRHLRKILSLI